MKKQFLLLLIILIVSCIVRLHNFSSPIADWHSWRQADTSAVSRNFVTNGFDLLHPHFDDLSNVPSGLDNPQGYRFVEFPIYNFLQAAPFVLLGFFTLEEWGRLVTISMSTLSVLLLYLIVKKHADSLVALLAAFFFAFLPFNIYFGRVVLPDPSMVTAVLGAVYFFDLWIEAKTKSPVKMKGYVFFFLATILAACALLLKPFAVFFLLPIVVLAYQAYGSSVFKKWELYVFAFLTVLPLILWRYWMLQFPEGIPVNEWLFNGGNIRFKGSYFYWIFADRIAKLILGYFGVALLLLGVLAVSSKLFLKNNRDALFFFSFLLSSLLYLVVVARGNVQHDYYQIPIIPSIALFLAFGSVFLLRPIRELSKPISNLLLAICTFSMFVFSWYHVRDYFNINNPNIIIAGASVDRTVPKDAKIITFYDGDTSFLYQTKRKGWSSLQEPLPQLIKKGASYLAIVNPTQKDFDGLGTEYQIVSSAPEYLILKLQ